MRYRREIDGLRAVAVIPVILFHAGFEVFSGGFVGVDVFFVISGYLITSIIVRELEQGNFSLLRFYERRARRILPALFFVMLVCIPFAWKWMITAQFEDFSQSIVAVSLFVSNILFWRESGYFASASDEKPLLHTWSLAVEEQYYLLFPLFLLLFWRFGRNRVFTMVIIIAAASLLLSEWGWRNAPAANFYLAPTRAWELLAGSICGFLEAGKVRRSSNILSALGLAMILYAILQYTPQTPIPSLYALAPVGGAVLVILYGSKATWTARLLSGRAFAGIGLISYSAYLWQQPLFAFARIRSIHEPAQWLMALLAVASLVLAYLSWRFVEMPFRKRPTPVLRSRRAVFLTATTAGAAFLAFGTYGVLDDGIGSRRAPPGVRFSELGIGGRLATNYGLHADCDKRDFSLSPNCRTDDAPEILLWGDSYAMHLAQALLAGDPNLKMIQMTASACAPIPGMALSDSLHKEPWARRCIEFNDNVLRWIKSNKSVSLVVMSSPFGIINSNIYNSSGEISKSNQVKLVAERLAETADSRL